MLFDYMPFLSGANTHYSNKKYLIFNIYICLHFLNEEYFFKFKNMCQSGYTGQ